MAIVRCRSRLRDAALCRCWRVDGGKGCVRWRLRGERGGPRELLSPVHVSVVFLIRCGDILTTRPVEPTTAVEVITIDLVDEKALNIAKS